MRKASRCKQMQAVKLHAVRSLGLVSVSRDSRNSAREAKISKC